MLTKEERFLIQLYKLVKKIDVAVHQNEVGALLNISPKSTKNICKGLAQANFIKKHGEDEISLTAHGLQLVLEIL